MENILNNHHKKQNSTFKENILEHNLHQQQNNPLQQQLQQSITEDYEVLTKLGSGAYGHVWKVRDKQTQQIYALKKVFSAFQNDVDAQRTYRQISYLQKLSKHQNIVKLIKVIKAKNEMDLYLLFQYMQSDLFYAIKQDLLNDLHKKYIIYQLAKCLKYVHSAGLVHRDVKPSNILINPNCEIRLCDFGLSRTLWRYNSNQETKLTEFIATRWYRAPQVLFGSQLYNTKSDMWSVGCLIYQLYARRPLLPGNDTVEQIQKVLEFKGFPNTQQKKSFRIPKIDEVLGLFDLQKKPLNQYFKYIQCQEVKQILIHLLEYNPQKRWTAVDLLECSFLQQFREFQQQIQAQKQIKTGINDNERKSVDMYRNAIYNQFVYNDAKKCENIKEKLHMIRESKQLLSTNNNRVSQTGRKTFMRSSSQETEQRKPKLQNSKTMVSLHVNKGNKNYSLPNTQRPTHRKNMSSHNVSKFNSEFIQTCRVTKQKPVFLQMKLKKPQPKFEFNLNKSTTVTKRSTKISQSKEKDKKDTQKSNYPQYIKSIHQNSASKIPKMIQQKINHQRSLYNKMSNEQSQNKSLSKLLRTAVQSKEKKSPYISQMEDNMERLQSSTFPTSLMGKNTGFGHTLNPNKNGKQNLTATNGCARKLKRKAIVN